MKRIIMLFLLLLLLGCNTITTNETTTESELIDMFSSDFKVCEDACITDQSSFFDIASDLNEKVSDMIESIIDNEDKTTYIFRPNEIYYKDDIIRNDRYSNNNDIPILRPYEMFFGHLTYMSQLVWACDFESCGNPFSEYPLNIQNVEYGFNQTEGFYSFLATSESGEVEEQVEFKFKLSDDKITYERIQYYPQNSNFEYSSFDGTHYLELKNYLTGYFTLIKINVDTFATQNIYLNERSYFVRMYTPEENLSYEISSPTDIIDIEVAVSYYENMEMISALKWDNEEYTSTISFHFVNGWDSILYRPEDRNPYSRLLLNETPVFEEYQIHCYLQGLRYYVLKGSVILTEEEMSSYVYPEEFFGTNKLEELKIKVDNLVQLENPLNAMGLTHADLEQYIIDQQAILQNRFDEQQ